eukprot:764077-Rhodomonas_salina.2
MHPTDPQQHAAPYIQATQHTTPQTLSAPRIHPRTWAVKASAALTASISLRASDSPRAAAAAVAATCACARRG